MAKYKNKLPVIAGLFKAVSDESRLRIVIALIEFGELCVCQIVELLEWAPSTVSGHLRILKNSGIVKNRKKGRWVHYRIADEVEDVFLRELTGLLKKTMSEDLTVNGDFELLRGILKEDPEKLCLRQKQK